MVNRRAFQPLPVGLALALMGAGVEGVGSLAFQCPAPSRPSSQARGWASGSCQRGHKLYMTAGNGKDNNKDRLDELYYQRFMGNEAELAESSLAELADYDPTVIDSLRQPGSFDQERPGGGVSAGSQGFLSSVKKAMPTFPGGAAGSSSYDMMSGPKVYIIPQNQGEAPLEIRSVAPGQRGSRKGVIAEIPGRAVSSKWARSTLDLSRKVDDVKRSLKEAPTRLTEMQIQNLRSANPGSPRGGTSTQSPPSNQNDFSFASFTGGPAAGSPPSPSSLRRLSSRRGKKDAAPEAKLQALGRDWRAWVGLIAAVSFLTALVNAVGGHREELMVMNDMGVEVGELVGHAERLLV